ncbi:MAG: RNA-binding protein [Rhodomicrobium sp.]
MPKGPKGEKRPADVIANAVKIAKIATHEIEEDYDTPEKEGKDPAAVSMGKRGGKARASVLSPRERAKIASKAAQARWSKSKEPSSQK